MSLFAESKDLKRSDLQLTGTFVISSKNISTVEIDDRLKQNSQGTFKQSWFPGEPQDSRCISYLPARVCTSSSSGESDEDDQPDIKIEVKDSEEPFELSEVTKEDCELVYRKWRYIRHDLITFSSLLLKKLGKVSPGIIQKLSPPADPKKYENFVQKQECLKRVLNFSEYLDKILLCLESPDEVYKNIYDMAGPHGKLIRKPLTKGDIRGLTSAIIEVVTTSYKSDNSLEVHQAYEKVLKIIFTITEDLLHWDDFGEN